MVVTSRNFHIVITIMWISFSSIIMILSNRHDYFWNVIHRFKLNNSHWIGATLIFDTCIFSPLEVTNPDSSSTSDYSQENDFWSSGVFEAGHARNACQCRFDTLAFFGINDRMIEMYFWSISNCLNEQFWSRLQVGEKNTIQHMIYRLL